MLAQQIRKLAHRCADDVLRRRRGPSDRRAPSDRPGPEEWDALRELLGVHGEPAPGTAEHERFLYAERIFRESFRRRIRGGPQA